MTSRLTSWLFSRNPRILLIALASLWIAQMAFWAIWEWQREAASVMTLSHDSGSTQSVSSVEATPSNVPPQTIPDSPFLSGNSEVLSRYFDYANTRSDALSAYLESDSPVSVSASDSPASPGLLPSVLVETNSIDLATTLRYRGFLQTAKGVRIAFIEDSESASTHRLRVGERFKEWTLQSIKRDELVFVSDQDVDLTILRQKPEAPTVSQESDTDPTLAVVPGETAPQSETNSAPAQEALQP